MKKPIIEVYDDDYIRDKMKKEKAIIDNLNNERVATLKEFKSLSEKRKTWAMFGKVLYEEKDIKKAVKLLKESKSILHKFNGNTEKIFFIEESKIDEIFGDDLI